MLQQAQRARQLLQTHFKIDAAVYSVTSFSQLAHDGMACERAQRLGQAARAPWIAQQLQGSAPVIAATDYVRAVGESVRAYIAAPYTVLGCDGFGRSDTRAQLRDFFEVDARWIAHAALHALGHGATILAAAAGLLGLDTARTAPPWVT
jgi:pyruvate dehydrogenase E1 component